MDLLMAAEAASESGGSGYWQLAMILAGIGFLGFFARWRKRRAPKTFTARELRERDDEPNRYRDAADRAIVELLETSRSLNAQVDTKIRMLNRLVKDAEEASARLEGLLAEIDRRANGDGSGPSVPVPSAGAPSGGAETSESKRFLSDLHERIFRLRDEGKSMAEIAKATNLSIIEVEFAVKNMGDAHA